MRAITLLKLCLVILSLPVCLYADIMVYGVGGILCCFIRVVGWAWGSTDTRPSFWWSAPPLTAQWALRVRDLWDEFRCGS